MKRFAFPLAILAALVVGFASSQFVSTARAQGQPQGTASCAVMNKLDVAKQTEGWMNEQMATGRRNFFTVQATVVCAW